MYPEYALNYFSVPNGGLRGKVEASIMKAEGATAGVSDTILLVPIPGFHGLCIEFKQETYTIDENGKEHVRRTSQSKDQKAWQKAVEATGYKYVVIHTFDEFVTEIEADLGKRY